MADRLHRRTAQHASTRPRCWPAPTSTRAIITTCAGKPVPKPRAVVRPKTTEDVSALLRLCHREKVPVTTQGGMTGLVRGGAAECERDRAVDGADEQGRGGGHLDRRRHRAGRHAAAENPGAGRAGRLHVSARPRLARQLHHRRQHLHQCRRQPRHPLRHDPRPDPRPRSRHRRRHGAEGPAQIHQEQHRHRPEAPVHRLGGHSRRGHARSAAHLPGAGGAAGGAVRAAVVRPGRDVPEACADSISAASSRRSR